MRTFFKVIFKGYFFHFVFTHIYLFSFVIWYVSDVLLGWLYMCCWHMCMGLLHVFWQGLMFFLGTWIGSNDLIMGSVCVTDKIYETRACQKWGKVRKGMKQDYGNNEPVILGNENCPSMHSVFESSVRASFKISLIFGLSCLYQVAPEPIWFLWCHAAHLPSSVEQEHQKSLLAMLRMK